MKSELMCKPVSSIFLGGFFCSQRVKFHTYVYVCMYGVCMYEYIQYMNPVLTILTTLTIDLKYFFKKPS